MSIFEYAFMQRALVAGLAVGFICAILSVYIVLRHMAFVGHGIGHASFGGVALGILLGVNVTATALLFAAFTGLAIGVVSRRRRVSEDSAIGIFLVAAMALGVLFIFLKQGFTPEISTFLFGNILAVTRADIIFIVITGAVVLAMTFFFSKELMYSSFDEEMAAASGVPVDFIRFMLLTLIALTIVTAIKVVGVILVSALLVIPAVCATLLTVDFKRVIAISVALGLLADFFGLLLSYYLDVPSGATIVLLLFGFFLVSYAAHGIREWVASR
ncbi:MAG: metal ABC transporter permease [Candidatus Geothermincolia bacterium]